MRISELAQHHARITVGIAKALCEDIPAARFGRMVDGVHTNHPAFVLSHLLIYPDRSIFALLGRDEIAKPYERYEEIAALGKELRDDPEGTIYPGKEALLEAFVERYTLAGDVAAQTAEEVFLREQPNEKFRERFPTIGAGVVFLLGSHAMMHMGQISAWRRMIGLGSAM